MLLAGARRVNSTRILLAEPDRHLATVYGESLAAMGFHTFVAENGESVVRMLSEVQPRAVVLDLVQPALDASRVIRSIRENKATRTVPILGLPTELASLARDALDSGATKVLERFAHPLAALVNAVTAAIGPELVTAGAQEPPPAQNAEVRQRSQAELANRLAPLRQCLQALSQQPGNASGFRGLLQQVHACTELAALLQHRPVFQMAASLETLVFDLCEIPEQINPSILRTLGQGIDLLHSLINRQPPAEDADRVASKVMVVDDDANSRQLIAAALQLVQLPSATAATPAAALEALVASPADLIFLDVGLPEINGFQLCTKIRALPMHEHTPIVFLTGMATFQNRVQSSLSGGNDFIGKPFNLRELGLKALTWIAKGTPGKTLATAAA